MTDFWLIEPVGGLFSCCYSSPSDSNSSKSKEPSAAGAGSYSSFFSSSGTAAARAKLIRSRRAYPIKLGADGLITSGALAGYWRGSADSLLALLGQFGGLLLSLLFCVQWGLGGAAATILYGSGAFSCYAGGASCDYFCSASTFYSSITGYSSCFSSTSLARWAGLSVLSCWRSSSTFSSFVAVSNLGVLSSVLIGRAKVYGTAGPWAAPPFGLAEAQFPIFKCADK